MTDGLRKFLIATHGEKPDVSDRLLQLTYPKEIAAFEAGEETADIEHHEEAKAILRLTDKTRETIDAYLLAIMSLAEKVKTAETSAIKLLCMEIDRVIGND